jgi:pimeloyl-ACP methyl ester carboxylesterase
MLQEHAETLFAALKISALLLCPLCVLPRVYAEDCQADLFDSAGVKIHYVTAGQGEAVVLIHGLYSNAMMNWQLPGTFKALAANHQVIALDCRGHGESGKPTAEDAYGLQMVEDIARLLDHLKIEKAHIAGYSMGGMITLKFLAKHPERALSGTLGGMGWLKEGSVLQKFWEDKDSLIGMVPGACIKGFSRFALTKEELESIKVPVKVLVGSRDPCKLLYVAPLETVRKDWPVIEIEDAGHLNCIFKPRFISEMKKWIDGNKVQSAK